MATTATVAGARAGRTSGLLAMRTPLPPDDPETEAAPPDAVPPNGSAAPWWRSGWALAAAIGVVVVAVTAVALVTTLRSSDRTRADLDDASSAAAQTQAELDRAEQDLQAQRVQLAAVLDKAKAVGDQLDAQTAARDGQSSALEKARTDLTTLSGLLNSQKADLYVKNVHLGELTDCINKANAALGFISFGDRDTGIALLQDSSKQCDAVSDYLASIGAAPANP
jgi:hypothetical protein